MPKPITDYRRELRFAAWLPVILGGFGIACAWIPYFAAVMWGVQLLGGHGKFSESDVTLDLWLGLVATAIVTLAAFWMRARRLRLLQNGVWTKARPIHIGSLAKAGMSQVTFAYIVNGQQFTKIVDVYATHSDEYDDNTRIPVVYDPHNPSVCHILNWVITTDDNLPADLPIGDRGRGVAPLSARPGSPRNPAGGLTPKALTGLLFWRKWLYDIDNRAAQETGDIFEPIIANAIGGTPAPAGKSPIKRRTDGNKGRQIDCVKGKKAYEFKLRVTIAASGQGRWKEELDFPHDCRESGYTPVLVVLDSTPNDKLAQLEKAFMAAQGGVYIGKDAWTHLDDAAGRTMARFLNKYVRLPIQELLAATPNCLPKFTATMSQDAINISIDKESIAIARTPVPADDQNRDDMPEDATDQLPGT